MNKSPIERLHEVDRRVLGIGADVEITDSLLSQCLYEQDCKATGAHFGSQRGGYPLRSSEPFTQQNADADACFLAECVERYRRR